MAEIANTIFTYHAIDQRNSVISVKPGLFRRQMELLAENDIVGISLGQAMAAFERSGQFPARSVVLTFDDGYVSVHENALPVMKSLGFSGTVFIPTDFVGLSGQQANKLNVDLDRKMMNWQELEVLKAAGFELGAHSKSHPDLTRLTPAELEDEIGDGKRSLEKYLGEPALSFAYPYGYYNEKVRQAAGQHFRYACTTELGHNRPGVDWLLQKRIDVYYLEKESMFLRAATGGLGAWWKFRQGLRAIKSSGRKFQKPPGC